MLLLNAQDVRQAITMTEAIEAVREGYIALSKNEVTVPLRGQMQTEHGITLTMPANQGDITAIKLVSVFGGNPKLGLPTIHAMILVNDGTTGAPLALMDGASVTAIRTGAGSGVATKYLAREDVSVLGVIGSGTQAVTQIEAVCAVRDIHEIRVYSPNNAQKLVDKINTKYAAKIIAVESEEAALSGADIIIAATNSSTPVVHSQYVADGSHVNGVGSFTPQMQEVDSDLVLRAKVVVDHRDSVWEEAGELIIPRDAGQFSDADIHAEIGEVAAGDKAGRISDNEVTFFKSVGNAIQDVVTARKIIENAKRLGIGTEFEF